MPLLGGRKNMMPDTKLKTPLVRRSKEWNKYEHRGG